MAASGTLGDIHLARPGLPPSRGGGSTGTVPSWVCLRTKRNSDTRAWRRVGAQETSAPADFSVLPSSGPSTSRQEEDIAPPASSRLEDARGSAARAPTTAQAGDSPFEPFSPNWRPPAPKPPSPAGRTPAAGSQASHLRHACGRETLSPEALRVQPSDSESPRSRKRQQEHLLGSAPCTAFPEHVAPGGRARAW